MHFLCLFIAGKSKYLGFFCSFHTPCVSKGRVGEGHPPVFCFPFFYSLFFPALPPKRDGRGLKRAEGGGIIPFTTCSVQSQASSEGRGHTRKKYLFPLIENHFFGGFPSFPAASPLDGTEMLGTKMGKPRGDPSRAQGVGGGCRANIIRGER